MKTDPLITAGQCSALHSKSQYILSEPDPSVPPSNHGLYWCVFTQTCVGPDGKIAEPANCCSADRECHCDHET
jgi:hypothetical protein